MVVAFIQVVVRPGSEERVKGKVRTLSYMSCKVEEAYMTYGSFDIVVKIRADSASDIHNFVLKLREIDGIKKTETSLVLGPT